MYVKEIGGNLATKGETILKGNLEQLVEYVLDVEKRPEYDKMYNSGCVLKDYGGIGIVYQKFNGIFPVKSRDFVILLCKERIEKGFLMHCKSIEYDYPADGKSVRAIAVSAGFELKEVEPGMIKVTYITESDPCGDLPGIVKRQAGKMQSGVIIKFREVVMKRFKWHHLISSEHRINNKVNVTNGPFNQIRWSHGKAKPTAKKIEALQ